MKRKMTKKMLLTLLTGVGLISSVALPLTMTSCGSNDSGKNNNSQPSNPDNKPPVQETITLNVQPSDEVFRHNTSDETAIINKNKKVLTYNVDGDNTEYLANKPRESGKYNEYFYPLNHYFSNFMQVWYGLYNDDISQKLFNPDNKDNAAWYIYNNVDLAANIMMKHIMNDGLIWLFFDIAEEDWLKIKDKVDLTFDFTRQDKIVNGLLTIKEKPNSNLKLEGNLTSTFSFELYYSSSGVKTVAPLYVDFNAKTEQTVEDLIAKLTIFLESKLFLSRTKAWDYSKGYPQVSEYKSINDGPTDEGDLVSFEKKNGSGLQEKPNWYYSAYNKTTNEDFKITNLEVNEIVDLMSFLTGLDLKKSFNYNLGLYDGDREFSLALQYAYSSKDGHVILQELNRNGFKTDFKNLRSLSSNKKIGFGDIINHLPKKIYILVYMMKIVKIERTYMEMCFVYLTLAKCSKMVYLNNLEIKVNNKTNSTC